MNLNDPYDAMAMIAGTGAVPGGHCDGLVISVAGTISFTPLHGNPVVGLVVVAGQDLRCRVKSIETLSGGAAVAAGYHIR